MTRRDQTVSKFFGDYTLDVEENVLPVVHSYIFGNVSPHPTYQDLSRAHGRITETPKELIGPWSMLYKATKEVQTKDWEKHFNRKYYKKGAARNQRWGTLVAKSYDDIPWNLPSVEISADDVLATLDALNLRPKRGWNSNDAVRPPNGQASLGMFVSHECQMVITGHKKEHWEATVLPESEFTINLLKGWSSQLKWKNVAERQSAFNLTVDICKKLHWCYVPTWRLDGGPFKLRMLYMGQAPVFVIENRLWRNMKEAMLNSPYFGYRPPAYLPHLQELLDMRVGSFDFKEFDKHQSPELLRAVYEAWQRLCDLPEYLVVALFLYNSYAPTLIDYGKGVIVRWKKGGAASGIGGFANVNSLISAAVNRKNSIALLGDWEPGVYMGDDHGQPCGRCAVARWASSMKRLCGLGIDVEDSPALKGWLYFLRRFYSEDRPELGEANIMSRARNAVFPEHPDPWSAHPLYRGIATRAQSYEIYFATNLLRRKGFDALINKWDRLVPAERMYVSPYVRDSELARRYQVAFNLADDPILQKMDYVKRYLRISDFSDVL